MATPKEASTDGDGAAITRPPDPLSGTSAQMRLWAGSAVRLDQAGRAARLHDADRAGDARPMVRAVPVGDLAVGQVLLVIILGEVEIASLTDLGRDRAVPRLGQSLLVGSGRLPRGGLLAG